VEANFVFTSQHLSAQSSSDVIYYYLLLLAHSTHFPCPPLLSTTYETRWAYYGTVSTSDIPAQSITAQDGRESSPDHPSTAHHPPATCIYQHRSTNIVNNTETPAAAPATCRTLCLILPPSATAPKDLMASLLEPGQQPGLFHLRHSVCLFHLPACASLLPTDKLKILTFLHRATRLVSQSQLQQSLPEPQNRLRPAITRTPYTASCALRKRNSSK
jgi:hypothetical protein